jgi:hypothetical protein
VFIVALAGVIAGYKGKIESGRDVLKILGIAAIPFGLVIAVGDLGTGLVFVAITLGMLLIGGMSARWFLVIALVGTLSIGVVLKAGLLQDYQVNRLLVFVDPTRDPTGAGYNLEQSKIAIGSGELTGKGLSRGTQSNLNFLPERHTDFIFSVLGEELGFVGAVLLLGLYLGLLITALEISASARDLFGLAHRRRHHRDVDVPDSGERRHDDRPDADHRDSASLHELRVILHGHQPGGRGYASVSVDPPLFGDGYGSSSTSRTCELRRGFANGAGRTCACGLCRCRGSRCRVDVLDALRPQMSTARLHRTVVPGDILVVDAADVVALTGPEPPGASLRGPRRFIPTVLLPTERRPAAPGCSIDTDTIGDTSEIWQRTRSLAVRLNRRQEAALR